MLSHERIAEIYETAITYRLFECREALLWNASESLIASIPTWRSPGQQMRQDLHRLNGVDRPDPDELPLISWLKSAKQLVLNYPDQVQRISEWIEECQALAGTRDKFQFSGHVDNRLPKVLVTRPSDDMLDMRRLLICGLKSAGIPVLMATYSDDLIPFKSDFERALEKADVVIQLFGSLPARSGAGVDLTDLQVSSAVRADKPIERWRDVSLLREDVEDAAHQATVFSDNVMANGFEDFKTIMMRRYGTYTPAPPNGMVFIDTGKEDEENARQIFEMRWQNDEPVILRSLNPCDLSEWKALYATAARVIIFQKYTDTSTINAKLRRYVQLRGSKRDQDRCVVFRTPAPPKHNGELTAHHPDFKIIYAQDDDISQLVPYL